MELDIILEPAGGNVMPRHGLNSRRQTGHDHAVSVFEIVCRFVLGPNFTPTLDWNAGSSLEYFLLALLLDVDAGTLVGVVPRLLELLPLLLQHREGLPFDRAGVGVGVRLVLRVGTPLLADGIFRPALGNELANFAGLCHFDEAVPTAFLVGAEHQLRQVVTVLAANA